jgi:membrane protease YdiL (CAAX protease family)
MPPGPPVMPPGPPAVPPPGTAPPPPPPVNPGSTGGSRSGATAIRWGLGDVLIGIVLFFVSQAFIAVGVVTLVSLAGAEVSEDGNSGLLLLALTAPVGWAVMVGWPLWLSRVKGTGSPARDFGLAMRPTDLLLGVGGGLMALGVSVGLALTYTALAGEEAPSNTDILTGDLSELLVVVLLFVIIAIGTPIAEEVFFRGLVLGAGRKRWGTVPGVLFSSLLFGAFHVQPDPVAWLFVGTVTAGYGVVFALMRVWTQGRLAASVVAHMVVNGVAVLAVTLGG